MTALVPHTEPARTFAGVAGRDIGLRGAGEGETTVEHTPRKHDEGSEAMTFAPLQARMITSWVISLS